MAIEQSRLIFLVNDLARAIKVAYDNDRSGGDYDAQIKTNNTYTFKTLDQNIKVGDFVVVPTGTRHGLTVCKVAEVDVDVDLNATTPPLKWIVDVVDMQQHSQLLDMEAKMQSVVSKAEKRKQRDELRDALIKDANGELKALPIVNAYDSKAVEQKT